MLLRTGFTPRLLSFALVGLACLVSGARAGDDKKPEEKKPITATGTWTWTMKRQDREITNTLKLKQDGKKLTGTLKGFGGDEIEIADGKVEDGEVSFKVTREFNGNTFNIQYKGKLEDGAIKGKRSLERGGETRASDWEAKREKDAA